jgi:hypothetical protein
MNISIISSQASAPAPPAAPAPAVSALPAAPAPAVTQAMGVQSRYVTLCYRYILYSDMYVYM